MERRVGRKNAKIELSMADESRSAAHAILTREGRGSARERKPRSKISDTNRSERVATKNAKRCKNGYEGCPRNTRKDDPETV